MSLDFFLACESRIVTSANIFACTPLMLQVCNYNITRLAKNVAFKLKIIL